jgi:hypothetical protein
MAAAAAANAVLIAAMQAQIDVLVAAAGASAPQVQAPAVGVDSAHNAAIIALMRRQAAAPPPTFRGATTGTEAHRWIQGMELYFDDAGIRADADRIPVVARCFLGPSQTWWEGERARTVGDPARIVTWVQLVKALRARYEPVDVSGAERSCNI